MKTILEHLHAFWAGRQAREKAFLLALTLFLAVALLAQLLWSSHHERARLAKQIPQLAQQVETLQRKADDLRQLKSQPPVSVSAEGNALLGAMVAAAKAAGLPEAGAQLQLEGARKVRLRGTLPFDRWLQWTAALQRDAQVRLVSCRIQAAGAPGSATIDALFALPEPS
jgi:type II secretory pathway component PulM